jgi:hypothetical protein
MPEGTKAASPGKMEIGTMKMLNQPLQNQGEHFSGITLFRTLLRQDAILGIEKIKARGCSVQAVP